MCTHHMANLYTSYQLLHAINVTLTFDLGLQPTTMTYDPSVGRVNVDPCAKNQGHRSSDSTVSAHNQIDGQTTATKSFISLLR